MDHHTTGFALPSSFRHRMLGLFAWVVMIVAGLVVEVIRCRRWAPWLRFVGTVVLVVLVVLVFRDGPASTVPGGR